MLKLFLVIIALLLALIMYYITKSQQFLYIPIISPFPNTYISKADRSSADNLMQWKDMCGVYAYNAVAKIIWSEIIDPSVWFKQLSKLTLWNGILPFTLEDFIHKQWLVVKVPNFQTFSKVERLQMLKQELSSGNIIILSVKANWPHYITLLGYNEDEFYIYDSFYNRDPSKKFTDDDNGMLPGNRSISNDTLLERWSQWWMYGIYNYYAMVVGKNK